MSLNPRTHTDRRPIAKLGGLHPVPWALAQVEPITPNRERGPRKPEHLLILLAKGWEATIQKYRPRLVEKTRDATVGHFIAEVKAKADLDAKTIEGYCKAFRTIVAVPGDRRRKGKFDYHKGGHKKWLADIGQFRLTAITPSKVQGWKRAFLTKAKRDPLSQRRAKVSVNSFLRRGRCLFSRSALTLSIELPDPLPSQGFFLSPVNRSSTAQLLTC